MSLTSPKSYPRRIRAYDHGGVPADGCSIWEAVKAATASPLGPFTPAYIPSLSSDEMYWDASYGHVNPSREALWEAVRIFEDRPIAAFVSLGTCSWANPAQAIVAPQPSLPLSLQPINPRKRKRSRPFSRLSPFDALDHAAFLLAVFGLLFDEGKVHREMQKDHRLSSGGYFRFHPLKHEMAGYTDISRIPVHGSRGQALYGQ